ncbi:MAG: hypothetical protein AVDCRST_MAG59-48, partial [uncultured Thermomicrobiales bacterium]
WVKHPNGCWAGRTRPCLDNGLSSARMSLTCTRSALPPGSDTLPSTLPSAPVRPQPHRRHRHP